MMKKTKIRLYMVGILVLLVVLAAAGASYLVPCDPYEQNLMEALQPPGARHLLGTDRYGRDMLSRVIMGSQTTVFSALLVVILVLVIGSSAGILCGYLEGAFDTLIMRISDIFLAFPGIVFAIAVASVLKGGVGSAVLALACISWPKYARIARSQTLTLKKTAYVEAARLAGSGTWKILFRHILPNLAGSLIVTAVLDIGTMMMEIAGLSFLGLGAAPPTAEWGAMMSNGRSMLQTAPWTILAPGGAMFLTVALFNLFGDAVRDALDPRQERRDRE